MENGTIATVKERSRASRFFESFLRRKTAVLGLILVSTITAVAIAAPLISPHPPTEIVGPINGPPARLYPLGTDRVGRDVLTRLIYGTRASLVIGVGAQSLSVLIGLALGMGAGYYGGKTDFVLMRIVDVFMAFPFILLAILVVAAIGPSIENVVIAVGVTSWTGTCRILRGETLRLREETYVEAARVIGASNRRILVRHILPNLVPLAVTLATIGVGTAILSESSLSFLGLGVQPPTPSWGLQLSFAQIVIFSAPHLAIAPTLAIFLTVLGFNLLGDGLRDALDPREATLRG